MTVSTDLSPKTAPRVTPRDLTALRLVGSPSLAPGGDQVVAAVQTVDPDTLRYRSQLWSFAAGRPAAALTDAGPWSDTLPRFSPDGTQVAFLSDRGGSRRLWVVGADGTEPRALDRAGEEDGKGADAPGAGYPRPTAAVWVDAERLLVLAERPAEQRESGTVVVDWLSYKSDGAPGPLEPTGELWLVALDGTTARLPASADRLRSLAFDGRHAYYVATERHSDQVSVGSDVRRIDLVGGEEQQLWHCASQVNALAVTSAGTVLALASGAPGQSATPPRVWVLDPAADPEGARAAFPDSDLECERALLSDCRPSAAPALLTAVGEEAVFLATVGNEVALFAGPPGGVPRRISPEGHSVVDFDASAGSLALCLDSATRPTEIHLDGVPVSDLNTAWAARVRPVAPEPVTVDAADGLVLPGLLYRSPTGDGALLIRVHGGPHLAVGNTFDLETQTQLAAGYHVLLPNIRGSAGYGTHFRSLSVGEWGRADHADLMAVADWAVDSGTADPQCLYLAGGSYGGYLINWALTRTGRFRAAVSERSVSNLLSKYGTSDNGFTVNRYEFGGLDLFDDGARELLDRSPLRHAAAITTPLLLVHGERDQRCPIEQSEQLFVALRRLGREVVLVRLPGESHGYSANGRPDRRVDRLELIIDWLDTHPKAGG